MKGWKFKENSLDLIRLIAACQVMVLHSVEYIVPDIAYNWFFDLLRLFPGVPIFFFISGMLITRSFERSPSLSNYYKNRILRIYPALFVCVVLNVYMVATTDYFDGIDVSTFELMGLIIAKATILQFYNPDYMRGFGDGVLNGSLWTICVELQFYLLVPILYWALRKLARDINLLLVVLILVFAIANRLLYFYQDQYSEYVLWKLYRVSFAPWIYMFLIGMFVQRNFEQFQFILRLPRVGLLFLYVSIAFYLSASGIAFDNSIPFYAVLPLFIVVLRYGYSFQEFTAKFLKGNDISYGVYIWHMPLVNQYLYLAYNPNAMGSLAIIILSVLMGLASWFLVERPSLKYKSFSLKPVGQR